MLHCWYWLPALIGTARVTALRAFIVNVPSLLSSIMIIPIHTSPMMRCRCRLGPLSVGVISHRMRCRDCICLPFGIGIRLRWSISAPFVASPVAPRFALPALPILALALARCRCLVLRALALCVGVPRLVLVALVRTSLLRVDGRPALTLLYGFFSHLLGD